MLYSGIDDTNLPTKVKCMPDEQRLLFVDAFNSSIGIETQKQATITAYRSVQRSIQDAPNLREIELVTPNMCQNCWFYDQFTSHCSLHDFKTNPAYVCDDWIAQPEIIEPYDESSMLAVSFDNDSALEEIQTVLRPIFSNINIKWVDPDDFHLTLVFFPSKAHLEEIQIPPVRESFLIQTEDLELWPTREDGVAVVLRLNKTPDLYLLQQTLWQASENQGHIMSPFSNPDTWKAHITLGYIDYLDEAIELPRIKSVELEVSHYDLVSWEETVYSVSLRHVPTLSAIDLPIRSIVEHEDHTELVFVGMPYTGPVAGGKDLHRTFFSPSTDIGPLDHRMSVYFDHGIDPDAPKDLQYRKIGEAYIGEETEEGRFFHVLIKRRQRYHDMLMALHGVNALRGSAQAIASMYQVKRSTGEILHFHPAEFSLTVTPSNDYNTVAEVRNIMKTYKENKQSMANKVAVARTTNDVVEQPTESAVITESASAEPTSVAEAVVVETVVETPMRRMADVFEAVEIEQESTVAPSADLVELGNMLRSVVQSIGAIELVLRTIQENQTTLQEDQLELGERIARSIPTAKQVAAQQRNMSNTEVELYQRVAPQPVSKPKVASPNDRSAASLISGPWMK